MASTPRPPQPVVPALIGSVTQQLAGLADAISRKADSTMVPTFSAVNLVAPGGSVWHVAVDDAGALHATAVPRT